MYSSQCKTCCFNAIKSWSMVMDVFLSNKRNLPKFPEILCAIWEFKWGKKKKNHLLASFNIKLCQDFWSRVCLSSLMSIVSFRWLSGWLPTALASSFLPPQSSWYISYGCVLCWTVLPLTKVCKTSTLARHLGHFSGLEVMNGVASWLITVACSSNCAVVCCGE